MRIPIAGNEKLRKILEEAIQQRKLVIVAQRETARIVKPEDAAKDRVVFVAREEL